MELYSLCTTPAHIQIQTQTQTHTHTCLSVWMYVMGEPIKIVLNIFSEYVDRVTYAKSNSVISKFTFQKLHKQIHIPKLFSYINLF